jgi:biotin-(acetyl-CoA carboxylase) ligase
MQSDYLETRWNNYCLLRGRQVTIVQATTKIRGLCLGIDRSGGLNIVDEENRVQTLVSGVVENWDAPS